MDFGSVTKEYMKLLNFYAKELLKDREGYE